MAWIRSRRLKWVGHILRLSDKRLVKQTLKVIFDNRQEGDILMDVADDLTWVQLQKQAEDKDEWRRKVHASMLQDQAQETRRRTSDSKKYSDEVYLSAPRAQSKPGRT